MGNFYTSCHAVRKYCLHYCLHIFGRVARSSGFSAILVAFVLFLLWPGKYCGHCGKLIRQFPIKINFNNIFFLQNEDVIDMIYNSCWYNLNVSQQKMVLIMLRESQQAEGISIGGIAPLSLSTALQMTKKIYTFSMMLKQFLNK